MGEQEADAIGTGNRTLADGILTSIGGGRYMGILDTIGAMVGQGGQQTQVAGGLLQALEQHPGGIGGLLNSMRGNGIDQHVTSWASGQQATATQDQVQQGLGGTGIIESTADKAGVSPAVVTMAMTTLLPMLVQHFAPNGNVAPQTQFGGLAQQLLGKFL